MHKKLSEIIARIKEMPYIIILFAAANVIIFLITDMVGDTESAVYIERCGGMYPSRISQEREYWRFFTACFLHYGAEHLVNNMVLLCCVGSRLEKAAGHWKVLLICLISGICGSILSYQVMMYTGEYAVSAGASGIVFGVIGGLLWAVIKNRGNLEGLTIKGMILMVALSLYYGFVTIGVDNAGHIGGILSGFLSAVILYHGKCQKC